MEPKPNRYSALLNPKSNRSDKETRFLWHLNNFEMCPDQWGKPLKSPEFSIYTCQGPKFHILLYPGGVNENNSKFLSVYLVKTSYDEENFKCSCKLGIITKTDEQTRFEFRNGNIDRGQGKGLARFFEREKLLSSEKATFLPDGCLTIFCEINAINFKESNGGINSQLKDLSNIYSVIYDSGKNCDLYLHVGEKTFKAHKAILEIRFPGLLKNMDGNKCKIEGISSSTMDAVLRYLYTGVLNIYEFNLFEILSSSYTLPSHLKCLFLEKQNKIEVTTSFQKTVLSFSWNIQNFSSLDSSKVIHYPLIGDFNTKWTWFDLYLSVEKDKMEKEKDEDSGEEVDSDEESDDEYITIAIQRFSKDCKKVICTIKLDDDSKTFVHNYDKEDKWALPKVFSKSMLKGKFPDAYSDEIELNFEIAVTDWKPTVELEKKELTLNSVSMNQTLEDLKSFRKDLTDFLNNPKHCDVTLISSSKDKIPAHKFILSARSPIFCDMLELESAKKKNLEIRISDLDSCVIKDMLAYIYYNEFISNLLSLKQLYIATNKYLLPGLKQNCVNILKSSLKAETAADILIFADEWYDKDLKEMVYNFVCTNPLQIASSKEWEQAMLKRSDLTSAVLKKTLFYLASKNKIINVETD